MKSRMMEAITLSTKLPGASKSKSYAKYASYASSNSTESFLRFNQPMNGNTWPDDVESVVDQQHHTF